MLSLVCAVVVLVLVTAAAAVVVIGVEAWSVRTRVRTRLACELERARQAAALEEISRHRARIARELDALVQDPTSLGQEPVSAVEAAGVLGLPGGDRGAAA